MQVNIQEKIKYFHKRLLNKQFKMINASKRQIYLKIKKYAWQRSKLKFQKLAIVIKSFVHKEQNIQNITRIAYRTHQQRMLSLKSMYLIYFQQNQKQKIYIIQYNLKNQKISKHRFSLSNRYSNTAFVSDQSEIISYKGFGLNFCEEDLSILQNIDSSKKKKNNSKIIKANQMNYLPYASNQNFNLQSQDQSKCNQQYDHNEDHNQQIIYCQFNDYDQQYEEVSNKFKQNLNKNQQNLITLLNKDHLNQQITQKNKEDQQIQANLTKLGDNLKQENNKANNENQIVCFKLKQKNQISHDSSQPTEVTNAQNILENIFKESMGKNDQGQTEIQQDEETYVQKKEKIIKLQVKHQNKELFLQFISADVILQNRKVDTVAFVIVQDVWEDLYMKKVEEIQQEKMKIFGSLSHELRTPLNCSISMLEVLKDEMQEINPQYITDYLNPALFSNKLLLNQINDILDFVQMDKGKFKYSFQEFNILNLLNDCQKLVSIQAQMKNLQIRINIDKGMPEYICSDPNRIRQILLNFLSNSLKFTKQGYIEINFSNFDNGVYKIAVQDTGIGIKPENLKEIFQFCAKINYSNKDELLNSQGCGLGLYISNSIAKGLVKNDKLNSGVSVESDYGKGSVFSFLVQDQNYIELFSRFSQVQVEATKMSIRAFSKQIDGSSKNSMLTSAKKSRNNNSQKTQNQMVKILKQNATQHSLNEQYTQDQDEQSKNDSFSLKIQDQKDEINNLSVQQKNEEQFDSSILVELDEQTDSKICSFSPNFIKQNNVKFQEEQDQNNKNSLFGFLNKSNSVKINQSDQNKQAELYKKSTFDQMQTSNKSSNYEQSIQEQQKSFTNDDRILTDSNLSQETSKNIKFSKNKSKYQSVSSIKYDQKHEGFTSYTPFNKLIENQMSSQNNIASSSKKIVKFVQSQVKINSLSNDQYFSQCTLEIANPQYVIDQIILNNISKQKKCNCPQILIIDDNQFNIYALSKTIETFQFQTHSISDSLEVLDYVKDIFHQNCCLYPKIIFMDIEMPFKNGYQLSVEVNQFYNNVQLKQLPVIIACTAYVGQEDNQKAIQAGMSDFINKPLLKNAFQQLILNWQDLFL
ncbi:ATPase, histidine kinase-, DNA gyrase B (macronuclear) [Tetrahymena thermophila SB210]|uniref:ATPase, histidine kinase-, DNA gyrase B n=1 Tax=Tetrahymena thermophila (strain SB210) TaxID=312017 RepID=Q23EA6_TETTS|nr:ATPase, histidine kinase-, DNA gyrase B [Tetrahymena thermophila SB210]EAR94847.2 ATPase, histidine kinase-, DNA gyrase B [Tetrahymena thermophila SB210]|eukprot:XP_001015092.2 ATPase, histidine kinase-, DNA gyrase B [Tetrahymena thermophila SB210]